MLIDKIKNKIANLLIDLFSNNDFLLEKFLIKNRNRLVAESINYPSIINTGYLHLEQVFSLSEYLNIKTKKGIVIDVGAADGKISLMLCNHFTGSDVYSFEPIKSTFDTLSTNLNGEKRIHLFKLALGSSSESLVINKSKRITSSSLFPIEEKIKDSYFAEHIVKVGEETINISTLDIEIPADVPVNLIKIDVQGFELEVLKGGLITLKRTSIIILEMQNHNIYHGAPKYHDLDLFLRSNNFILYNIIPSLRKNMKLYEWDAIYISSQIDAQINN